MRRWHLMAILLPLACAFVLSSGCTRQRGPVLQPVLPGTDAQPTISPQEPASTAVGGKVEPLSPRPGALLARPDPPVRALVTLEVSFELACLQMELDGNPVSPDIFLWDKDHDTVRWVVWYQAAKLEDGEHAVKLVIQDISGISLEAEWDFSILAAEPLIVEDPMTITLYFADDPLVMCGFPGVFPAYLTPVKRTIPRTVSAARAAVEQLIVGPLPHDGDVVRTLPAQSRLRSINIRDGVCYVDFNQDFDRYHPGGSLGGAITISSLVWTLTEFPAISQVMILVEGHPWCEGHFDLSEPVGRHALIPPETVRVPACPR
ncbi:MAG: GerMN domain-containing protein [Bacillota bacterium]